MRIKLTQILENEFQADCSTLSKYHHMTSFPNFSEYDYRIIQELGRNRESGQITYLATRLNQTTQVVIKQFCFPPTESSWSGVQVHEREIQILQRLTHPGIPRYLDSFTTTDGFCLVQEYINAIPLSELDNWTPEDIKKIAISSLEIIAYLQNFIPPVFHRNIKPENILVDEEINVYLINFGLSCFNKNSLNSNSRIVATPGFIPPESLYEINKSSDLYSLGVTLICLLTGTKSAYLGDLSDSQKPYLFHFKHLMTKVHPRFIQWLEKMVEPNTNRRFSNAARALGALKPLPVVIRPPYQRSTIVNTMALTVMLILGWGGIWGYRYVNSSSPNQSTNQVTEDLNLVSVAENSSTNQTSAQNFPSHLAQHAGNSISLALDLGFLPANSIHNGFLSNQDREDYYRFQLNNHSKIQLSLNSFNQSTYVELILDRNQNGQLDEGEILYKNSSQSVTPISKDLGRGNYLLRVYQMNDHQTTTYTLKIASQININNIIDPGNSLDTALKINLQNNFSYSDFVGSVDTEDYYQFELNKVNKVEFLLNNLKESTYLEIILDRNQNGQLDEGEILYKESHHSATAIKRTLGAGTYWLRVYPRDNNDNTTYTLKASAQPVKTNPVEPGNHLNQALDLGNLQQTKTYNDFVGSVDLADYYRFRLNRAQKVQLSLSKLREYVYLELIFDRNNNNQIEQGEVIYQQASISSDEINQTLATGNYLVRIYPKRPNNNTTYTLKLAIVD